MAGAMPRLMRIGDGIPKVRQAVFNNSFQDLRARFPRLSTWLGKRLEVELPAVLVSFCFHGILLMCLAFAGYRVHQESNYAFEGEVVANVPPLPDSAFQDLDQSSNAPALIAAAGSFAPNLAPTITTAPSSAGVVVPSTTAHTTVVSGTVPELVKLDARRATELIVPSATMLGQTVSIRGNGAELVGGVEGAIDRIAIEILRHLEQSRTLVVWAFDASGSLQVERERLSKHIDTVYTHINQLDENQLTG